MIRLDNLEDALNYIEGLHLGRVAPNTKMEFGGELATIRIVIEGPEFKGTVTGELSRGLAQYQDEVYRAAKFAFLGREGRVQLTPEQRKSFELVFQVNNGCSELVAQIKPIADALAEGISNMDPVTLAITVVSVVLVLTTGYAAIQIVKSLQETRQKGIESQGVTAQSDAMARVAEAAVASQARLAATLQGESRRIPVVRRFEDAQEDGVKDVLRSVPTATSVEVAGVGFDADDIKEIRRRSPRSRAEWFVVSDAFRVFGDTNYTPVRLTLSGASLPGEFYADFPDELDAIQANLIWEAIRTKGTVNLEVAAAVIREKVKSAFITDVIIPENDVVEQARKAA